MVLCLLFVVLLNKKGKKNRGTILMMYE